jgi:stage II sporulation protein AA (anti-sigma F factor antagonist)
VDSTLDGEHAVVRPRGEVDLSSSPELWEHLLGVTRAGCRHIVLDCRDLRFLESTGLSVLIRTWQGVRARGGSLQLRNAGPRVTRLVILTGLQHLIGDPASADVTAVRRPAHRPPAPRDGARP